MQQTEVKKAKKSQTSVADFIAAQLAHLPPGKTQKDVALALGYEKPNIIVMFKKGDTRLPINKIPAFAKEIGIDPAHLLRMALNEYMPEALEAIEKTFGKFVSDNEFEMLRLWREATADTDPKMALKADFDAFRKVAESVSKIERGALTYAQDDMRKKQDTKVKVRTIK